MELDELHVGDGGSRAPGHRHPVARRDVGVRRVKIDLPAAARSEDQPVGPNRLDVTRDLVEHVSAEATVLGGESKFPRRNQIDGHVMFQQLHPGRRVELAQQRLLDLKAGHVLHMQDPSFRMATLPPEIGLAMPGDFAIVKMEPEVHQLLNARRTFHHDRPDCRFVAQAGSCFERVLDVKLERILVARHASDPTLRPGGIGVGALALGNHRDRSMGCRLQGKSQPGNTAADDDEIVFLHGSRILSINRVCPKKTATAMSEFGWTLSTGCNVSALTSSR